jgi:hypothetical protein
MNKLTEITPRNLAYELDGVITDVEVGCGFDDVCMSTIKRVRKQLIDLELEAIEDRKIKTGEAITVPVDKEHAEAMLSVALFYLEQFKEKEKDKVE